MARKSDPKYKKPDLIREVVEMFSSGQSQYEIINWLKTEGECSISYCYEILRESKPFVIDTLKDISRERLEMTINELEKLKTEAKLQGDRRLALEYQKEINKISGLYKEKVDITTDGEKINNQIKVIFVNGDKGDTSAEKNA